MIFPRVDASISNIKIIIFKSYVSTTDFQNTPLDNSLPAVEPLPTRSAVAGINAVIYDRENIRFFQNYKSCCIYGYMVPVVWRQANLKVDVKTGNLYSNVCRYGIRQMMLKKCLEFDKLFRFGRFVKYNIPNLPLFGVSKNRRLPWNNENRFGFTK